jgi:hypothetical protein
MQPAMSWQQLEPHYNALVNAIGADESVNLESYDLLCNHLSLIPDERVRNYREQVVEHLLSLRGQEIENPYNLHPGDHLEEYIIGIPRANNSKTGDLLGLELKTFTGSSPLTLTSFSCVKELVDNVPNADNMWDVVWFPTHVNHDPSVSLETHHLRANENLLEGTANRLGRVSLNAEIFDMEWEMLSNNRVIKTECHEDLFIKFRDGLILLDITGTKNAPFYRINAIYHDSNFNPQGIAQHFRVQNIKFEIRFDLPNKNEHGRSECDRPRNSGHAFRMTVGTVRRTVMQDENLIEDISDFIC